MRWFKSKNWISWSFIPALGLLVLISVGSYWSTNRLDRSFDWVNHTHQVLELLQYIDTLEKDIRSSVRSYIITGQENDLQPYFSGRVAIPIKIAEVRVLTSDNPNQQQRLDKLEPWISTHLALMQKVVDATRHGDSKTAVRLLSSDANASVRYNIDENISLMEEEERHLLIIRSESVRHTSQRSKIIFLIGSLISSTILVLVYLLLRQENRQRENAEEALEKKEQYFRSLIENATDIITIINPDATFRYVSPSTERVLGYKPETEMVGRIGFEFVHPDDRAMLKGYFESGIRNPGSIHTSEVRFKHKDGSWRMLECMACYMSQSQVINGIIVNARDITERKQAEIEIESQRSILQSIVDSMGEGLVVADPNGKFILFNPAAELILGIGQTDTAPTEWSGQYGVFHIDMKTPFLTEELPLVKAIQGGPSDNVEMFIRNAEIPGGAFVSVNGRAIRDKNGVVLGGMAVLRDITQRRRTEQEIREAHAFLESVIENIPDMIFIKNASDLRFVRLNKAGEDLLGHSREDLLGKNDYDFFPKEQADFFVGKDREVLEGHDLLDIPQEPIKTPRGARILHTKKIPIFDGEGKARFLLGISEDITERRRAEEMIRYAKEKYEALLDSAAEGVYGIDMAGRCTFINKAGSEILGYAESDLIGKNMHDMIHSKRADGSPYPVAECPVFRALPRAEASQTMDDVLWRKDGNPIPVEYTSHPLRQGGLVQGAVVTFSDITERKKMETAIALARDAALESARFKSEFMANMSHEIRTPMNAIIGVTSLLMDGELKPKQREFMNIAHNACEALLQIINDILDFSKIEAGKFILETIDVDVRNTVEDVSRMLAERSQAKGIEIACFVYDEIPALVQGDPGRLRQVLTNLVGNAVKFTEHGEIIIQVTQESVSDSHVQLRFTVKDTGIGISEDVQSRLFQAFTQADGSTTRRYGGTGLGLAISKRLVELMGGEIGVRSEPGNGSEFWFTVPFLKHAQHALKPKPRKELEGTRVLIVDDNETNRKILHHQIIRWGMSNGSASNGPEALAILRREAQAGVPYDLAILDMQMPGMDGLSLAQVIKTDASIASTRLVIMTSLGNRLDDKTLIQAGVSAYLGKPVKQSELFDCLASVMSLTFQDKPLPVRKSPRPTKKSRTKKQPVPLSKARLLLAEDNRANQQVALFQLEKLGYKADVVSTGREVLEARERKSYDLILMDCQMPEMDGYQTTVEIRWQEGTSRHTPIIAMTANALEGDRQKCLDAGMDDYISKPIRISELKARLEHWLKPVSSPSRSFPAPVSNSPAMASAAVSPVDLNHLREATDHDEPGMRRLVGLYLTETAAEMGHLQGAVEAGNAMEIRRIAHGCAGASATYGMPAIAAILRDMEHLSRDGQLADIPRLMMEARAAFEKIKIFWKSYLEGNSSDEKAA